MTPAEEQELAEAVLASRGYGFGPALDVIRPVVQRIVLRHEDRAQAANVMLRDYGRLLIAASTLGGPRG